MRKLFFAIFFLMLAQTIATAQQKLNLKNAVVVGLFDKKEERFQMEIMLAEILIQHQIKSKVSLNFIKEGADIASFANDSIQESVKKAGFENYILISVRGYETKFKPATIKYTLEEELKLGHLFPVFREEISNVTFEFKIYRGSEMIGYNLLKVPSPSNEGLLKKFKAKIDKLIKKHW